MFDSLIFSENFKEMLAIEVENTLQTKVVKVGEQFDSTDSYSFLIITEECTSYVGKIFRFPDWPPEGKLEAISKLLTAHNITHEEIVFITHHHEDFKYGWQLSKYIPGGTARDLLNKDVINKKGYFEAIGKLLSKTHIITASVCGAIIDKDEQFFNFSDMVTDELLYQSFQDLPAEYAKEKVVLENAKTLILNITSQTNFEHFSLVHDDAGAKNVMWNNGNPILIDWVDAVWAPPVRDFATLTFSQDESILPFLEKGYGKEIPKDELYLHQLMRLVRLAHFYYFEGKRPDDFKLMVSRTSTLLKIRMPFGV